MSTPTFGTAPKKRLSKSKKIAIFGVAALGGIGIYLWYRNRQANAATQSTSADTTNSGIDPNTGQPYSSEAYYDPNTGQYYGLGAGGVSNYGNLPGTQYATDNATWAQASESYLTNQGFNPTTVATALGLYLAGLPLTQDQYDIVQAAIGAEGTPPNGAPSPKLIGGGGGGQRHKEDHDRDDRKGVPPPTTGVKVAVPNIVGMRQAQAQLVVRAKGLRLVTNRSTGPSIILSVVVSQNPGAGTKVKLGSTVTADLAPAPNRIPARRR